MMRRPVRPAALVAAGWLCFGACTPPEPSGTPGASPAASSVPTSESVAPAAAPPGLQYLPFVPQMAAREALPSPLPPQPTGPGRGYPPPGPGGYPGPAGPDLATAATGGSDPAPCAGIVDRDGERLVLAGEPVVFFGVNAHNVLDPEFPEPRAAEILAALADRGVNTVRVWFFAQHDLERFERLLDLGRTLGLRYVVVLGDNVFKGRDWFFGRDDEKKYRPHLERTVSRFAGRPEILAWEVINEPNCGDGGFDDDCLKTIKDWVTMASRMIKALDACHPVSSGMIGDGNFDTEREVYKQIHKRDSIDLVSVHRPSGDPPADELELAEDIARPIYYGEVYDRAYGTDCEPLDGGAELVRRAGRIQEDLADALDDGADGYLLWDLSAGLVTQTNGRPRDYCGEFGYALDDPVWARLAAAGLPPRVPWAR